MTAAAKGRVHFGWATPSAGHLDGLGSKSGLRRPWFMASMHWPISPFMGEEK
jgi:hypothetical protein